VVSVKSYACSTSNLSLQEVNKNAVATIDSTDRISIFIVVISL